MSTPNIVVTGAGGFLGKLLVSELLKKPYILDGEGTRHPVERICAFDQADASFADPRVTMIVGDLRDPAMLSQHIDRSTTHVFHLAAIVSSQAEAEFDLGYSVNFHATSLMLEHIRGIGNPGLRLVATSSIAVYGGKLPEVVTDQTVITPQSSYGSAKAMSELLVTDYARRGMVDALTVRLPTVIVRPGKPNRAASSFASGIIREPIEGIEAICPVAPATLLWITSPRAAVANLLHASELTRTALTAGRTVNLPGLSVTVQAMIDCLAAQTSPEAASRIKMQPDGSIQRIVNSWPGRFDTAYGSALGFVAPPDFSTGDQTIPPGPRTTRQPS